MRFLGGCEILLPMQNAGFKFSYWIHGKVVDVNIDGKNGEKTLLLTIYYEFEKSIN